MRPLTQKTIRESAFVGAVLCINILILFKALTSPVIEFDTQRLVAGVPELSRCLGGVSEACKEIPYFAPLQQLPALLLHWLGATFDQTLLLLAWLTTVAVVIVEALIFRWFFRSHRAVVLFFAATVLSGPVLPYLASSFAEGLTVAVLTACVMVFVRGGPAPLTALLFTTAAISKDTAPLWCLLTALTLWLLTKATSKGAGKSLSAALIGTAAGGLILSGFNLLRYDSVFNTFHSQPVFLTESLKQILIQLSALFASPNGGLLWFWTVPLLLVAVAAVSLLRSEGEKKFLLPLTLTAGGLFVSMSLFYSPFGWVAWGNRIGLPWIYVIGLILVLAGSNFSVANRPALRWIAGVAAGLWQLPHAFAALSPAVVMSVFKPAGNCPGLVNVMVDKGMYTTCLNTFLWPEEPSVLFTSWTVPRTGSYELLFFASAAAVSVLAVCLYLESYDLPSAQPDELN